MPASITSTFARARVATLVGAGLFVCALWSRGRWVSLAHFARAYPALAEGVCCRQVVTGLSRVLPQAREIFSLEGFPARSCARCRGDTRVRGEAFSTAGSHLTISAGTRVADPRSRSTSSLSRGRRAFGRTHTFHAS